MADGFLITGMVDPKATSAGTIPLSHLSSIDNDTAMDDVPAVQNFKMASLDDLPIELISRICDLLDKTSVLATRLVNKRIEASTFAHFGRRFFRKRGYLITKSSLDVLRSIAAHESLRTYVEHIWFNPDLYTGKTPRCVWHLAEEDEHPDRAAQVAVYQQCCADHRMLLHNAALGDLLRNIFSRLPNLQVLGMRRGMEYDGQGWRQLKRAVGTDPREIGKLGPNHLDRLTDPTRLFIALVCGVAGARSLSRLASKPPMVLKRLYNDMIQVDHILETLSIDQLGLAFRDLESLELNVALAGTTATGADRPNTENTLPEKQPISGLRQILTSMPKLQDLSLQLQLGRQLILPRFRNDETEPSTQKIFAQLSSPPGNTIALTHLTKLKLENLITSPEALISFLHPSSSKLISLDLHNILLTHTHPPSDTDQIPSPRPWDSIFTFLQTTTPSLSNLHLSSLRHETGTLRFLNPLPPTVIPNPTQPSQNPPTQPHNDPFIPLLHLTATGAYANEIRAIQLSATSQSALAAFWTNCADRGSAAEPVSSSSGSRKQRLWTYIVVSGGTKSERRVRGRGEVRRFLVELLGSVDGDEVERGGRGLMGREERPTHGIRGYWYVGSMLGLKDASPSLIRSVQTHDLEGGSDSSSGDEDEIEDET